MQKAQYAAALDKQLKDGLDTLEKECAIEKQMLKFSADKEIALTTNAITERLVEQTGMVDERKTFAILELKKAAVERKIQLDAQASGLVMDFQMKSVQVEWVQRRNLFEQQYLNAENKLEAEYNKQVQLANTGTAYAAPAPVLK